MFELNKCARQLGNLLILRVGLALLALALCLALPQSARALFPTGNLHDAGAYHTSTLLPNGKVLVVGGQAADEGADVYLSSSELYDPATGTCPPGTSWLVDITRPRCSPMARSWWWEAMGPGWDQDWRPINSVRSTQIMPWSGAGNTSTNWKMWTFHGPVSATAGAGGGKGKKK
jgi:Galactose oxidase, central domain